VLIGVAILVALVLAAGLGGWFYINSVLSSITRFPVAGITPETSGAPIDILLIGSDSRKFVSDPGQVAAYGNPLTQTGQRSDVIIVLRLVPKTHQIEMLSIPRDTYVPIPGTGGSNRINAAFNTGPSVLVKTIQQNFGIPINHVVVANFPGFQAVVNSLGGISLDFPDPLRDQFSGLNVTTLGCQTVKGATALALVRSRHLYYFEKGAWNSDGMSDWSRIQRQQAFFHAVIDKANSEDLNPLAMNSFLNATAHDLQVDAGFSPHEMISLGLGFRGVASSSLVTKVLPTYGAVIGGNDVLIAAQPYARQMVSSFLAVGSSPGSTSTTQLATTTTTTSGATTTTVPPDQVVFDNPKTLPEPWNPKPC
jgi:LCP family protein required for cell wall assembly